MGRREVGGQATELDRESTRDWFAVGLTAAIIILPWVAVFVAIPPGDQQFPLNDDWAFSKGALAFASGHGVHYEGWASMPLLGQWLWALPFVWALGPSLFTLRLSTIVLSWVGLTAFFDLLRRAGLSARLAAFATCTLGLCPYFVWLAGTFMSDVPALAFSLAAMALYVRAMQERSFVFLTVATIPAVLAGLTRQNTIAVSITAAVLMAFQPDLRRRSLWWIVVAVPAVTSVGVHLWLQERTDIVHRRPEMPGLTDVVIFPFIALHLAGLAALPALALGQVSADYADERRSIHKATARNKSAQATKNEIASGAGPWSWEVGVFAGALAVMVAGVVTIYTLWPDYVDNRNGLLFPYPDLWLPETNQLHEFRPLMAGQTGVRFVLSGLGCLGGAMLVARLMEWTRRESLLQPLLIFTAIHGALLLLAPTLYGRYLLVLVPGALLVACRTAGDGLWRWGLAVAVLGVGGTLGVAAYHDWLAWNSARWRVGWRAVEVHHIPVNQIEGGLEWDGRFAPAPAAWEQSAYKQPEPLEGLNLPFMQQCFPHLSAMYALAFAEIPGTETIDREPYSLWLFPGPRFFYLVRWTPEYREYRQRVFGR